jgi:hypothetical protein
MPNAFAVSLARKVKPTGKELVNRSSALIGTIGKTGTAKASRAVSSNPEFPERAHPSCRDKGKVCGESHYTDWDLTPVRTAI